MESRCHNLLYCPMSDPLAPSLCLRCDTPCHAVSCHVVSCRAVLRAQPSAEPLPLLNTVMVTVSPPAAGPWLHLELPTLSLRSCVPRPLPVSPHPSVSPPRVPIPPCPTSSWSHAVAGLVGGCSPGEYIIYTVVSHSQLTVYDDILPRGAHSVPRGAGGAAPAWGDSAVRERSTAATTPNLSIPPTPPLSPQPHHPGAGQAPNTLPTPAPPYPPRSPSPAAPEWDEGSK